MTLPVISKSDYLSGTQCPKLLWFRMNNPSVIPPPDADTLATFEEGNRVNEYSRKMFPTGVMVEDIKREDVVAKSSQMLDLGVPLFEAGFSAAGLYARVDILVPVNGSWDIIEVKSGGRVKPENILDVAFQKLCLEKCGLKIGKCFIMHINKDYVRNGEVNVNELFVKEEVEIDTALIEESLPLMQKTVSLPEFPPVPIGTQCNSPYECSLKGMCWSFLPSNSVMDFYRDKKLGFSLLETGVTAMAEVEDLENDKHKIQRDAARSGKPYFDAVKLKEFFNGISKPVSYLDFETIGSTIPIFDNTSPYEALPFQYSLHVEDKDVYHKEFLFTMQGDPRLAFIEALIKDLPTTGTIISHNASFEKNVLLTLAKRFPQYQEWVDSVIGRFVDSLKPFQNFHYYHPAQHGSCSIKAVLPALTGLHYGDLIIGNGALASREYYRATYGNVTSEERAQIYQHLLTYCKLDTHAMVEILRVLRETSEI